MDKLEVICNAELYPNYFPVNVSVLAVVFCQQILENRQFYLKLWFFEIIDEIQQLVWKLSQKISYGVMLRYISVLIYPLHFPKFYAI